MGKRDHDEAGSLYNAKYGNRLAIQSEWIDQKMVKHNLELRAELKQGHDNSYHGQIEAKTYNDIRTQRVKSPLDRSFDKTIKTDGRFASQTEKPFKLGQAVT